MYRSPLKSRGYGKRLRRQKIEPEQFVIERIYGHLSRQRAADLLGVSLRTVGHWETGRARIPYAAFKLLRVLRRGEFADPRWSGYMVNQRGFLVTPENREFAPSDMSWLSLLVRRAALASEVRAERARLVQELAGGQGGAFDPAQRGSNAASSVEGACS